MCCGKTWSADLELIPDAVYCLNAPGGTVEIDFLSDSLNVRVYCTWISLIIITPDELEDLISSHNLTGMRSEEMEYLNFLRRFVK